MNAVELAGLPDELYTSLLPTLCADTIVANPRKVTRHKVLRHKQSRRFLRSFVITVSNESATVFQSCRICAGKPTL